MARETRGFVKVPNALLDNPEMPDRALRLWVLVRQYNGEKLQECWASAATLDGRMKTHRRRSPNSQRESSRYKLAQRYLIGRGLMVVVRRLGRTSLRWALSPGVDGELELNELTRLGKIGDQLHAAVMTRRSIHPP